MSKPKNEIKSLGLEVTQLKEENDYYKKQLERIRDQINFILER